MRGRRWDRGSGTVVVLGAVAVVAAMTVGALLVLSAVVASHRAQSAADLAALAAAAALVGGEPAAAACSAGAAVATRNGARLASCRAGPDLSVELSVDVAATAARVGTATARSRAGPAASGGARSWPCEDPGHQGWEPAASKVTSRRVTARVLSSGSLPLPHFGDCTQDGQPDRQGHPAMASRVPVSHCSSAS